MKLLMKRDGYHVNGCKNLWQYRKNLWGQKNLFLKKLISDKN